jgi:WD40 repeat protein
MFRAEGCSMLMAPDPLEDATVVDISHESLIRQWKTLKDWAQDHAEKLRPYLLLVEDAALWERKGRSDAWLSQGQRLADAIKWSSENPNRLSPFEKEFLARSQGALAPGWFDKYQTYLARAKAWDQGRDSGLLLSKRELEEAEAWLAQEQPNQQPKSTTLQHRFIRASRDAASAAKGRRWKWVAAGAVTFAAVAFVAVWMAARYALESYSRELARSSMSEPNAEIALSVATYALRAAATAEATHAVHAALARSRLVGLIELSRSYGDEPIAGLASSDGRTFALRYKDARVAYGTIGKGRGGDSARDFSIEAGEHALLALSKDGGVLATLDWDGNVELRSVAGADIRRVPTGAVGATALSLSATGQLFAVGDRFGEVQVFQAPSTAATASNSRTTPSSASTPTSSQRARNPARNNEASRVSPIARGRMAECAADGPADVLALDFNAKGTCVAAGDSRGRVCNFAVDPKAKCPSPRQPTAARPPPPGSNVLVGAIAQIGGGALAAEAVYQRVSRLVFSHAGDVLASVSDDRGIELYDLSSPDRLPVSIASKGAATVTGVALSKSLSASKSCRQGLDGSLAVAWNDGKITRYRVCADEPTEEVVGSHLGSALTIAFVGNTERLVSVGRDGTARMWASKGIELASHELPSPPLDVAFFDRDGGSELAIHTDPHTLHLCTVQLGQPAEGESTGSDATCSTKVVATASDLRISKRGAWYVSAAADKQGVSWTSLSAPQAPAGEVKLSNSRLITVGSTGQHALVVSGEGEAARIHVVPRSADEPAWTLPQGLDRSKWSFVVSPDGQRVVGFPLAEVAFPSEPDAKVGQEHIVIWQKATPEAPFATPATPDRTPISATALTDDGKLLATAHPDGTVTLWDVGAKVNEVRRLRDPTNYAVSRVFGVLDDGLPRRAYSLAFDPNGQSLAIGYAGGIRVASTRNGDIVTAMPGDPAGVAPPPKLAYSSTGTLAAGRGENSVDVYELDPKRLLAIAQQRPRLRLNERDCEDYVGRRLCEHTRLGAFFWAMLGK